MKLKCWNCGNEFEGSISNDELGWHSYCEECGTSFDVDMYEVDLRDRKTGNSVECIYSGNDYEKAYEVANKWNKENILNYDERYLLHDYIDGTDGFFADVYHIEDEANLHGVGKFD